MTQGFDKRIEELEKRTKIELRSGINCISYDLI